MGMQKSEELKEVIQVVYEQFVHLNIHIEHTGFLMDYKERDDMHIWLADKQEIPSEVIIPYFDSPPNNSIKEAKEKGQDFFKYLLTFEEKNKFYQDLFKFIPGVPEESLEYYFSCPGLAGSGVLLENIGLYIENFSGTPYTDEENKTLMRFGKVFQQTYTRFLDLQKAEAQAREAQIEAALERVRARAMAMHKSEDILSTTTVVFAELKKLDVNSIRCGVALLSKDSRSAKVYAAATSSDGELKTLYRTIEMTDHPSQAQQYQSWLSQENYFIELKADELRSYYRLPFFYSSSAYVPPDNYDHSEFGYYMPFSEGLFYAWTKNAYSETEVNILTRFKVIIDLTFRRFLDLQKAEAQARESQIQLALERVRARTMAMQKSEEMSEVAALLFKQISDLGIETWTSGFNIWQNSDTSFIGYNPSPTGGITPPYVIPSSEDDFFLHILSAKQAGEESIIFDWGGEQLAETYRYMKTLPIIGEVLKGFETAGILLPTFQINHAIFFTQGFLLFITLKPYPEAHDIFKRFAKVFEQTYTRFLDLQKAEAQARESQIQLALERARSQSMTMQRSAELDDTLRVFHEQVLQLGIPSAFSFLWLPDEEKDRHIFWAAWAENNSTVFKSKAINYPLDRNEPATAQCLIDWKGNEPVVSYHVPPTGVENYFAAWSELIAGVDELKPENFREGLYYVEAFIRYGCFGVMVKTELQQNEKKILQRFAVEFEATYTRFLDLQKAEAQAREAQIELGLERVRARAMAMQKSDELAELVETVFKELTKLDFSLTRCIIMIMDDGSSSCRWWMANSETDKTPESFYIKCNDHPYWKSMFKAWEERNPKWVYDLKGSDKKTLDDYLFSETELSHLPQPAKSGMMAEERIILSQSFHNFGCLLISSFESLTENQLDILYRFTKAFDLTYTRFNDLQKAEAQARQARIEMAMEKVRSRAMAMQKPDELVEVAQLLRTEMGMLGVEELETSSIYLHHEDSGITQCWYAIQQGSKLVSDHMTLNLNDTWVGREMLTFYHSEEKNTSIVMTGEPRKEWINYCAAHSDVLTGFYGEVIPDRTYHLYKFAGGYMGAASPGEISAESWDLLQRATAVFSLAYTRFSDLQQAEAQARESQIQLALERVRARTMAMHKSNELSEVSAMLFQQFNALGNSPERINIGIVNRKKGLLSLVN